MLTRLTINTRSCTTIEDLTPRVQQIVGHSGCSEGLCTIFVPHTTAGIIINENYDPDVKDDLLTTLSRMVPLRADYRHTEGNADAHVKAALVGSSVSIPIENGRLVLGTWQGILLCEFDGPRSRQVWVQVLGLDATDNRRSPQD